MVSHNAILGCMRRGLLCIIKKRVCGFFFLFWSLPPLSHLSGCLFNNYFSRASQRVSPCRSEEEERQRCAVVSIVGLFQSGAFQWLSFISDYLNRCSWLGDKTVVVAFQLCQFLVCSFTRRSRWTENVKEMQLFHLPLKTSKVKRSWSCAQSFRHSYVASAFATWSTTLLLLHNVTLNVSQFLTKVRSGEMRRDWKGLLVLSKMLQFAITAEHSGSCKSLQKPWKSLYWR